jgi:hypothetical protein
MTLRNIRSNHAMGGLAHCSMRYNLSTQTITHSLRPFASLRHINSRIFTSSETRCEAFTTLDINRKNPRLLCRFPFHCFSFSNGKKTSRSVFCRVTLRIPLPVHRLVFTIAIYFPEDFRSLRFVCDDAEGMRAENSNGKMKRALRSIQRKSSSLSLLV